MTYTYVVLEVSKAVFDEIKTKLLHAGYHHVFDEDSKYGTTIDMHGIALAQEKESGSKS